MLIPVSSTAIWMTFIPAIARTSKRTLCSRKCTAGSPGTKLENLTVGVIQDYMVEAEKRMFAELVRDKRLGQDAYLPKDGSLEYKIMKSGREDLRTLQKIKHNYSWVIGVSKSFNPESCLDHTGKPNSNYIADLPVFQRFIIKPFYECLV